MLHASVQLLHLSLLAVHASYLMHMQDGSERRSSDHRRLREEKEDGHDKQERLYGWVRHRILRLLQQQ